MHGSLKKKIGCSISGHPIGCFILFHYLLSINDVNALGQCRGIGAKVAPTEVVDVFRQGCGVLNHGNA